MIRVVVCEAKTKTRFPGPGEYVPNDKGEGGSWSVTESPLSYYFLNVNGIPLGGIYMDRATADRDAAALEMIGEDKR